MILVFALAIVGCVRPVVDDVGPDDSDSDTVDTDTDTVDTVDTANLPPAEWPQNTSGQLHSCAINVSSA